jgi:hypothetical protein
MRANAPVQRRAAQANRPLQPVVMLPPDEQVWHCAAHANLSGNGLRA